MKAANLQLNGILFIAFFMGSLAVNAQISLPDKKLEKLYLQVSGAQTGKGDHYAGLETSMQAYFHRNWTATVSFHKLNVKPSNLPGDYKPAYGYTFFLFIPLQNTQKDLVINLDLVSITAGKKFPLGRKAWMTTEAGISLGKGEKASFTPRPIVTIDYNYLIVGEYSQTSNYDMVKKDQFAAGLMFRTDLSFAITRFMGIGWGAFADINSVNTAIGYDFKLLIGNMGIKKRNKDHSKAINHLQ